MRKKSNAELFRSPEASDRGLNWSPYLRLAHDYVTPPRGQIIAKDFLGDHALHYFFDGAGEYELEDQVYKIEPRCVFLVRPGDGYRFQLDGNVKARMFNLHFDLHEIEASYCRYPCPETDSKLKQRLPEDLPSYQKLTLYSAYEQTFARLLEIALRQGKSAQLRSKGLLLEIIALLYDNAVAGNSAETWSAHSAAVSRVLRIISSDPARHFTLDELAEIAGISRSLFCRVFRNAIGMTPQKYLNHFRIEQASTELAFEEVPVKEIAERYGFADVYHFSRVFKSITGESPAKFRKIHKNTLLDK